MNKTYTDVELQVYRLRLCARMDVLIERMPDPYDEPKHERWANAFTAYKNRYMGIEDMLIERGVELWPMPKAGQGEVSR